MDGPEHQQWQDVNPVCVFTKILQNTIFLDRQATNEADVDNFLSETTLLEKTTLNDIRSSFYCWKKEP